MRRFERREHILRAALIVVGIVGAVVGTLASLVASATLIVCGLVWWQFIGSK